MSPRRATVFVVEDDPDIREDVTALLQGEGYDVVAAENGAAGLDSLRRLASLGRFPGVVLLDLMMPVMDGWTMCREMTVDPELRGIPVVLISGTADLAKEAGTLGAAGFLVKPFQWEDLVGAVRRYC